MTYDEWKLKHRDEINEEIRRVSDLVLQRLYNTFSNEVYRDGFNDGYEEGREVEQRTGDEVL